MTIVRPRPSIAVLAFLLAVFLGAAASPPATANDTAHGEKPATSQVAEDAGAESLPLPEAFREISRGFTPLDWGVIAVYLTLTTILGAALAGRQTTIRDFFLGGRKLPWPAVCGSIIATELSAATFLIAPAIVFAEGGDLTYFQLAIGTILARFVIGYFFVPAFYEREIYSPYDYMGHRLGNRVKKLTTALFMIGAVLAQGARVYIAAVALQVVTGANIALAVVLIGAVSILWTWIGGIRAVIWTDVLQFTLFCVGAVVALVFIGQSVEGGLAAVFRESLAAGKLNVINTTLDTKTAYTLWCGLFATGWLTLASHGTDQMTAQRIFTCRNPAAARKAIIWSGAGQLLTLLLLLVGAGLWSYCRHHPLGPAEQAVIQDNSNRVFAVFIVNALPAGISGLLMAGIFAAAISTLDSVLAALSQSTLATIYKPLRKRPTSPRHEVIVSRLFVILWGVVMIGFAILCDTLQRGYGDLIQFALAMAAYTYGALLGTFLLAILPTHRDDLGLVWGVPLSMLAVFVLSWHNHVAQIVVVIVAAILMGSALWRLWRWPIKIACVALVLGAVVVAEFLVLGHDQSGQTIYFTLAWPWHFPIGTAITFGLGYLVGEPPTLQKA